MPRQLTLVCTLIVTLLVGVFVGTAGAQTPAIAAKPKTLKLIRTWAYVGPRAPLSGARIQLLDRTGRVLAAGKTTSTGTYTFDVKKFRGLKLPLSVRTSGGKAAGKAFSGHMQARVFIATTKGPIAQVSVISTAASQLSSTLPGYAAATMKVRKAMGIAKSALPDVLRLRNDYVGYSQLMRAAKKAGGFDAFAEDIAASAKAGKRVKGLAPASAHKSSAVKVGITKRSSTATCSYPIPSGASTSDQVITDMASAGAGILLKGVGVPTAATSSLVGMALTPLGVNDTTPEQADLNTIINQLNCISDQLTYLKGQIDEVQESIDVSAATTCLNLLDGTNAYPGYEYAINNSAQYPLNSSNTSLTVSYLPAWALAVNTCGSAIDDMLFGTAGGQGGAWQQLVENTLGSGKWYAQADVQDLQTFLSYWSLKQYEQFILENEYANYYGSFESAQGSAGVQTQSVNGVATPIVGSNGQALCSAGSTGTTDTYCVWANNVMQAYPADLYSDEIGIVGNGNAVMAVPGGVIAPPAISNPTSGTAASNSTFPNTSSAGKGSYSPTAMNPAWAYNYFLNFTPFKSTYTNQLRLYYYGGTPNCLTDKVSPCPYSGLSSQDFYLSTGNWFNTRGVNPNGYGTAVETYNNPQAGHGGASWSDISDIKSAGAGGQSSLTVLYNGLNQTPNGGTAPLGSVTSDEVLYMTQDSSSYVTSQSYYDVYGQTAYMTWNGALGSMKSGWVNAVSDLPSTPIFAMLFMRSWWPGAATAATYVRPAPPTS